MTSRFFAVLQAKISPLKVRQLLGIPPELTAGQDERHTQGAARFLVIEKKADGFFLCRFDKHGECVGDTWHLTEDEAKEQTEHEYGSGVAIWSNITEGTDDAVKFVMANIE